MPEHFNVKLVNQFTDHLPADPILSNGRRQVEQACYSFVEPIRPETPKLIHLNEHLFEQLGLDELLPNSKAILEILSGQKDVPNFRPYAMNYGGHQFGHWAGQLGDGRAINIAELKGREYTSFQLKGAGPTPYSRSADGLAVLRSSIREYLCSEAMAHLGVPTTRALSLVLSGNQVLRDEMYDGHPRYEQGAIVCRVAESFLRFGSFEIFAARNDVDTLKQLADYTLQYHFPNIKIPSPEAYLKLFETVAQRSLELVIHWQRVGFVHGVLNTDNMSILGLTIDYGPFGFLDNFDPNWTPNITDKDQRRYRFSQQPQIVLWNLWKLGNALFPLIEDAQPIEQILTDFQGQFQSKFLAMRCNKLGFDQVLSGDEQLCFTLDQLMQQAEVDFTIFYRLLSGVNELENPQQQFETIKPAFYSEQNIADELQQQWLSWLEKYTNRLLQNQQTRVQKIQQMNSVNPKYILRNYMAQEVIDRAEKGDYTLLNQVFELLKNPYDEQEAMSHWFAKRPDWARNKVGSSMLSCSS